MMQATGNLYVWGHDGDPDTPRASLFGGDWDDGEFAGSRCADVDTGPTTRTSGSVRAAAVTTCSLTSRRASDRRLAPPMNPGGLEP
jgi:hypothetical protein